MVKGLSKWGGLQMTEMMPFRTFMGTLFQDNKGNVMKMSKKVLTILGY